jgi:predicted RNA-binding protein YlxR (DUF448 family)
MGVAVDRNAGSRAGESPLRTCVVTRAECSPADLLRFVLGPDDLIVPDVACRLPGRGVWVSLDRNAVATAVRTKAFARSLKCNAKAAADLPQLVERLLAERALAALAMANKAGLVLAGNAKVETAIATGEAVALVHAREAAADGVAKLDRRYCAMCRDVGRSARIIGEFGVDQMSLALGRSNVVHAALKKGGAAELFINAAARLSRFRSPAADHPDSEQAAADSPA